MRADARGEASDAAHRGRDVMQLRYAGGRGVGAACSVWGWGRGRDVAQRREERSKRECGCGTRQGHGTMEGCSTRE